MEATLNKMALVLVTLNNLKFKWPKFILGKFFKISLKIIELHDLLFWGPTKSESNWCKNYELQNRLIRCEKVDFPYISMESAIFTKATTIFNTKHLFFVQLNQDRTYLKQY